MTQASIFERCGSDVLVHAVVQPDLRARPPGSKSLTNRALLCAALADGPCTLRGISLSDDAWRMIAGLRQLGVLMEIDETSARARVRGGSGHFPITEADLNVGDAGTAMRFLTAACCLAHARIRIDGSARMRERPIGELVGALQQIGARIGYEAAAGFPPLSILASGLRGGEVTFHSPPSSQFLSALLMIAAYASDDVFVQVEGDLPSRPYVELTLALMRRMGVDAFSAGTRFAIPAGQRYVAGEHAIEPDASAATYFWAAAAITRGRAEVLGLTRESLQGDVGFVDVLKEMGCRIETRPESLVVDATALDRLHGVDVDLNAMPDTVQTLAVAALFADGPTRIRNVANLKLKETDRLSALRQELTRLGAEVEPYDDGLVITPPATPRPAVIETYHDHRMAMSFALAGLTLEGVVIRNADCVSKSFPDYYEALAAAMA